MKTERERALARDIKAAIKAENMALAADLVAEHDELSAKNVVLEVALQFFPREREAAERALEFCIKRGFRAAGEFAYVTALVHYAVVVFDGGRDEQAAQALRLAVKLLGEVGGKAREARDFASLFLGVVEYRLAQFEACVRQIDELADYAVVLDPERFALIALVKARALVRLKKYSDALQTLTKRGNQEQQLKLVKGAVQRKVDLGNPQSAVCWCNRLQILLLSTLNKADDAVLLYTQLVKGSKPAEAKEFIKKNYASVEDCGEEFVRKWRPPDDFWKKVT